jgi:hypothetical protein
MKAVCRTVDTAEKRLQEGPQHDVCLECVHPLDRVLVKTRRLSSLPLTMACPPIQTPSRTTLWRRRKLQLGQAARVTQAHPQAHPQAPLPGHQTLNMSDRQLRQLKKNTDGRRHSRARAVRPHACALHDEAGLLAVSLELEVSGRGCATECTQNPLGV